MNYELWIKQVLLLEKILFKEKIEKNKMRPIISSVPDTSAPHFGIHRPKM